MSDNITDLQFNEYLDHLYIQLADKNKVTKRKLVKLPNPKIKKVGSTKTIWENFHSMAVKLNRPMEHLRKFFSSELGTECSLSHSENELTKLIIRGRGRYTKNGVLKILHSYIDTYVQCKVCGEMETNFLKEQRQFFVQCTNCLSKECCQQ